MKKLIPIVGTILCLIIGMAHADTPPPGTVGIKGGTDGTKIGNVGDALKVSGTSTISGSVTANQGTQGSSGSPWWVNVTNANIPVTQSGPWTVGRNWFLNSGTDSVSVIGSVTTSNASIGSNNSTAPSSSTQIGGYDNTGLLQSIKVDTLGNTPQSTDRGLATNSLIYGLTTGGGGGYVPVKVNPSGTMTVDASGSTVAATQSGTWNLTNISGTVSLPTGAATSTKQSDGTQKTQIVDGSGAVIGPAQAISGTNYEPVVLAASATPGSAVVARSIQVAGSDGTNARTLSTDASGNLNVNSVAATGRTTVNLVRNDYSSANVTTAAYTQLIASTADTTNYIYVFDSSGQTLFLAVGAAASEVNKFYIVPGGNGIVNLTIPSGSRVSVKAVSGNATAGELSLTLLK